jgi:opacity protein-like surface antigen
VSRSRTFLLALVAAAGIAAPVAAQTPAVSIRPFVMASEQSFTAIDTFTAVFGHSYGPFYGGGADVTLGDHVYVELAASRFKQTGQRAFRNAGQVFRLGIPLTATVMPVELTGGYRFHLSSHIVPYVGAGFGSYGYKETSDFADAGENVDTRHSGFVVNAGAEFRLHRWVGVGADVHYTRVTGILGQAGVSKDAGENDLGGVAARFKVIVGR